MRPCHPVSIKLILKVKLSVYYYFSLHVRMDIANISKRARVVEGLGVAGSFIQVRGLRVLELYVMCHRVHISPGYCVAFMYGHLGGLELEITDAYVHRACRRYPGEKYYCHYKNNEAYELHGTIINVLSAE